MTDSNAAVEPVVLEEATAKEFSGKSSVVILVVLSLLYILNLMDQQVMAAVLEMVKLDLGLSDTQAGAVQSIFYFSTAFFAFPCAVLVDKWSRRKAIGLMAIVWSLGTLATGMMSRFFPLAAVRFITGIGESGFPPGSTTWISKVFSREKRARILGLYGMAIPIGVVLGILIGSELAKSTGDWRTPFYVFAVPGVILGFVTFFLQDYTTRSTGETTHFGKRIVREILFLFRIRTLVFTWAGGATNLFVAYAFISWFPTMLMRAYGVDVAEAGRIVAPTIIIGVISAPFVGFVADFWQKRNKRGRMYLMVILALGMVISKILVYYTMGTSVETTLLFGTIDGALVPTIVLLTLTINADASPLRLRATALGISVLITYSLGGAWGPILMGAISDYLGGGIDGLRQGGIFISLAGLLSALFFILGSVSYPSDSINAQRDEKSVQESS